MIQLLKKFLKNYRIEEKYRKEFSIDTLDADNIDENRLIEYIKVLASE